jgi:methylase of polypeptide subunit release factors
MIPILLGTPEQFGAVRDFLLAAGFTEPKIAERAGAPTIYEFQSLREGRTQAVALNDRLDLLIRVFMDAEMVEWRVMREHVPAPALDAFDGLGLLMTAQSSPSHVHATVLLYPSEGGLIVSDLNADPDRSATEPSPPDVVYPAITRNTRRFLASQATTPCEHFLELCSGTGIAALRASRFARRAWAVDITERATVFAEFNARLNGITNLVALQGDLYEPVRGQTFDRIVAHPPYVPARENQYVFRDGGEDGEAITRRAVAGLPDFLRPGGRFYCTCLATDRKDAPLERRIRAMLGDREAEFDVLLVTTGEIDPLTYYAKKAVNRRGTFAEIGDWYDLFQRLEVTQLVHGTLVVERHRDPRPAVTARRQCGPALGLGGGEDWLFGWETAAADPRFPARLLASRPWASARAEVTVALRAGDGRSWGPTKATMRTDWPFSTVVEGPPVGAALVSRCDGRIPVAEHLAFFRQSGTLPPDVPDDHFLHLVRVLISAGILGLDEFPLPPLPAPSGVA